MTLSELANAEKTYAKDVYVSIICGRTDSVYTLQCLRKLRHILDDIEHKISMEQLGVKSDLKGLAAREAVQ
jgi:hypothetical protein